MDDFDYSVQISERDWDAFFQECEECDLLPPSLAGLDESSMSDNDQSSLSQAAEERDSPEADHPVDGPPECTGLPVEHYLSACSIPGPVDLLSCSEEDTHLESINKFFERLKGIEGDGSSLAEARPKEICALGEPAKVPSNLAQLPQAKSQSASLAVSPTAKEDKVDGTISAGRNYVYLDRAGKSIETESEDDEALRSTEPAEELRIREEDWTEDEEWEKEKAGYLAKDKLLKATPSCSTSTKDECGLSRRHTEKELQTSGLKDMGGTEERTGEGEMESQELEKEATSLYGHQVELQTDPGALLCRRRAAGAENQAANQQQEWQDGSRGHFCPSVKRKRRQIWSRGDPFFAGLGFEGFSERTESKKQVERIEQETTGQGEAVSGHDSEACVDAAGRISKSSANQMTQSTGSELRSSELFSEVNSVKESAVDVQTAEHDHDSKESVTKLACSKQNIPDFPFRKLQGHGHAFQRHSQQICVPASETEKHNLTPCKQGPESLQSGELVIQHDPESPQSSGLSASETSYSSEQFPRKDLSEKFHISEKSSSDQEPLKYELTLPINSTKDEKVSRKRNIPEHEHTEIDGQNLTAQSQEEKINVIRIPEIPPSKQFIEMPNTANPLEPPEASQSLNNIGEPSWCEKLDQVDLQYQKSAQAESPPEYQEVEEPNEMPIHISNDETSHQCQAKTDTGKITPKTSCSASENNESSIVTSDNVLFQESKLTDKKNPTQSDLVAALPDTYSDVVGLNTNVTESPVASDSVKSSVKSATVPYDSEIRKANQTDECLPEKGENVPETSTVECVKKLHQASIDLPTVNRIEAVLQPELQTNLPVDTPLLHTSENKVENSGESELSLQQESAASAQPQETKELNKALEVKRPVHTMSAFWREMEKLTINDILYLRSDSSSPRGLPPDSALTDTSDAGDSGYSSHLEDSKRSSADMSRISDFEEECLPSHSAIVKCSPEPKDKGQGSSSSRGALWEIAGAGMDNDTNQRAILHSGDSISTPFLSGKAQQGFRRMCKNISVRNLQALVAEPHLKRVTSATLVAAATEEEELQESSSTSKRQEATGSSVPPESGDTGDIEASAAPSLTGDEATEGFGTSLRQIFAYFFGAGEAGAGQADTAHTEVPASDGGSVPEMYDYFFSEFETENLFFPSIKETDSGQNEPVLMTSCSGASHRNLQFPEAYDYFFPDSSSSDSDDKDSDDSDQAPIRVVSHLDRDTSEPPGTGAGPDMYEHFFTSSDWMESLFWKNPLSLRRMRFTAVRGSRGGPTSCVVVTADPPTRPVISTFHTEGPVDFHGEVSPLIPLYCLEERIFRELAEKQRRYAALQSAVAVPNAPVLALKQSDMCLICIAFASWVLKTANPQDSETWKAALLANISALSAIRYIRRYVRAKGESENESGP